MGTGDSKWRLKAGCSWESGVGVKAHREPCGGGGHRWEGRSGEEKGQIDSREKIKGIHTKQALYSVAAAALRIHRLTFLLLTALSTYEMGSDGITCLCSGH